jgi:hypothetical protein
LSLSLGSSSPLLSTLTVFKLSGLHVMSMCLSLFEKEKQMISSSPWKQKTRNLLYCLFHLFSCPPPLPLLYKSLTFPFCCIHSPAHRSICILSLFVSFPFYLIISRSLFYHHFQSEFFMEVPFLFPFLICFMQFFIINVSLYLRNLELRQFLFSNATKILVLSCSPVTRNKFSHANEDPCPRNGSKAK